MRKIFSLFAAILFAGSIMAQVTITPANSGWTNEAGEQSSVVEGVTIAVTNGLASSGQNPDQIRIYKDATLTISSEASISKIEFTCTANGTTKYGPGCFAAQEGYTYDASGNTGTWEGSANTVTFTASSAQVRATQIVVTVGPAPKVATPVITGDLTFTDSVIVTMSCSTADADIYYTIDGVTDPKCDCAAAPEYKKPIVIKETTTIMAAAYTGNDWSAVATKTFTKVVVNHYDVAEAIAAEPENGTEMFVRGVITKMQIKGKNFAKYGSVNIYVADATGAEGEFEFYNCFSLNADTFKVTAPAYDETSTDWVNLKIVTDANGNQIRLGDTIEAFGAYKLYNKVHELDQGCYLTQIKPAPVLPGDTIDINMSEGILYYDAVESEGWWQIYGANEKYDISISNLETAQAEGTYTIADLDPEFTYLGIINGNDTTYISFIDGAVTLSINPETGDVTVAGQLVGFDDNVYNINLLFVVPTPKRTVNVNIANGALDEEYAEAGLYTVYGEDENGVYVQLSIWAESGFQGEFTEADLDLQYVGSGIAVGEETISIYAAEISVIPGDLEGNYMINADVLCYNNTLYKVTMTVPASTEGIDNTNANAKATKSLRNGILVIEKNGIRYDVTGRHIR